LVARSGGLYIAGVAFIFLNLEIEVIMCAMV
jgi:hypothetical protein